MKKRERQKQRSITLSDSYTNYARSISPEESASEGIRIALDYYRENHPRTEQPKDYEAED